MSNLQIFNYQSKNVRTLKKDGQVWFVAKDVCDVLELTNAREAIKSLDDDERNTVRISDGIQKNRGNPNVNLISESGVYALVFRSNKPEAKNFARWVRKEVLPQIMHTGSYSWNTRNHEEQIYALAEQILSQRDKIQSLEAKIEYDRPKVDFADEVAYSDNSYSWQDMANSMAQNGADIGQNRAVKWGLENKYLCRRSGHSYLQPTLKAIKQGLLEIDLRTRTVRITPKGILKLTRDMEDDRQGWLFDPEEYEY
ncbi:MAG: phage antirepressor KilAC domain-containing protein [Synergistaceae bacterium]|nr:phage antirepressor KilAC domain-containing protein [Synergistaceae bacterium]